MNKKPTLGYKNVSMNGSHLNSPHLLSVIRRLVRAGELTIIEQDRVVAAYKTAIQGGGAEEIGFTRALDQSFNPRAARILLILIQECRVTQVELLVRACEMTMDETPSLGLGKRLDDDLIRVGFILDRLRHYHLETVKDSDSEQLFEESMHLSQRLHRTHPRLSSVLHLAQSRARKKFEIRL